MPKLGPDGNNVHLAVTGLNVDEFQALQIIVVSIWPVLAYSTLYLRYTIFVPPPVGARWFWPTQAYLCLGLAIAHTSKFDDCRPTPLLIQDGLKGGRAAQMALEELRETIRSSCLCLVLNASSHMARSVVVQELPLCRLIVKLSQ